METQKPHKITFSPPKELSFDQHPLELVHRNRSQAFPDLARWNGRFYLAFRTAPSHFPSTKAHLQIFTSVNGERWQSEYVLDHIHDVRDPHFLEFRDELYLFFMSHTHGFRRHGPETISYMKKTSDGWTEPVELHVRKSGFWDVKASDGRVYMSAYSRNGEGERKQRRQFRFLASSDLKHWETLITSPITRQTLGSYETSEASFVFDPTGMIVGTIRSLIYPNLNFSFHTDHPENWKITVDRFKCDGPRLFNHNGEYYLAARRSLFYGLRSEPYRFFPGMRNLVNMARYSFSRKRTAIYHFDIEKLQISHITDLPSHGDTGYSAVAHLEGNQYLLVYYSSDIGIGKDVFWARGQLGETKLYSTVLTFR
jgi:hypothetical protein